MKKTWLLLLCLILGIMLTACNNRVPIVTEEDLDGPNLSDLFTEPEPEPEPILNPLNNLPVASEQMLARRLLIVSIDNYKAARPQAGISTADLMYEVPAEGGISRLMAVFYVDAPDTVGPVRSARPYMVDIAREWQGMFVHCGGSDDALNYLAKGHVNWLNEIAQGSYFWRDKSRRAPHNLYTNPEKIYEYIRKKEWPEIQFPRAFQFLAAAESLPAGAARADLVRVNYPYTKNFFEYNAQTGLYARSIGSDPHIDANNEQQVQAANILVQRVTSKVLDSVGRLSINMVGEGEAMLFTQGTVQMGRWKRNSLEEPTYFSDENGQEWKLAAGQTWIEVCDGNVKVSFEDTTAVETEEGAESGGKE